MSGHEDWLSHLSELLDEQVASRLPESCARFKEVVAEALSRGYSRALAFHWAHTEASWVAGAQYRDWDAIDIPALVAGHFTLREAAEMVVDLLGRDDFAYNMLRPALRVTEAA